MASQLPAPKQPSSQSREWSFSFRSNMLVSKSHQISSVVRIPMKQMFLSFWRGTLMSSDTSPPRPSTSLSRTNSRMCSLVAFTNTTSSRGILLVTWSPWMEPPLFVSCNLSTLPVPPICWCRQGRHWKSLTGLGDCLNNIIYLFIYFSPELPQEVNTAPGFLKAGQGASRSVGLHTDCRDILICWETETSLPILCS